VARWPDLKANESWILALSHFPSPSAASIAVHMDAYGQGCLPSISYPVYSFRTTPGCNAWALLFIL
jgi:hypothetical protein